MACETWLANDFLIRHGHDPGPPCHHPSDLCPSLKEVPMPEVPAEAREIDSRRLGESNPAKGES